MLWRVEDSFLMANILLLQIEYLNLIGLYESKTLSRIYVGFYFAFQVTQVRWTKTEMQHVVCLT